MNRDRAWRRKQTKYKEIRAFKKIELTHWWIDEGTDEEQRKSCQEHARKLRDNMKSCSCPMCGNPRKWWNDLTIQEKKANDIAKSQDLD